MCFNLLPVSSARAPTYEDNAVNHHRRQTTAGEWHPWCCPHSNINTFTYTLQTLSVVGCKMAFLTTVGSRRHLSTLTTARPRAWRRPQDCTSNQARQGREACRDLDDLNDTPVLAPRRLEPCLAVPRGWSVPALISVISHILSLLGIVHPTTAILVPLSLANPLTPLCRLPLSSWCCKELAFCRHEHASRGSETPRGGAQS